MRILVTGSRDWDDTGTILTALVDVWNASGQPEAVTVIHGGASGADMRAAECAAECGWRVEEHRAQWVVYGRRAGILRNIEMVDAGADICLAFIKNNSPGATHCANYAEKMGIPVWIYRA